MKKVALVIRSLDMGGAERQLVVLASNLCAQDFDVRVFSLYPGGALENELDQAGVPVTNLVKRGRWDLIRPIFQLIRGLRKMRPDIIHSYLPVQNVLLAVLKPVLPRCRLIWGIRASSMDINQYDWLARLTARLEALLEPQADQIIANSEAARSVFGISSNAASRMIVIPNGIDTDRFKPNPSSGEAIRKLYSLSKSDEVIGIVARLDPMKDHRTFLKAAAMLLKNRPSVKFVCIGNGPDQAIRELTALAKNLNLGSAITWLGAQSDVEKFYPMFSLHTLSSSFGEGFPNTVAESMSTGIPNVATNIGDVTKIIDSTGYVVSPNNPDALAQAWNKLLSLPKEDLLDQGSRARRRVIEHYSVSAMVQKTEAIYGAPMKTQNTALQ